MEKETELYLIQRIKELESDLAFYKGKEIAERQFDKKEPKFIDQPLGKHQCIAEYQGHDVSILVRKANAYDMLNELLGFEACVYPQANKYELVLWKVGGKQNITKKQYEIMREVIDK